MKSEKAKAFIDENETDAANLVDKDGCGWAVVGIYDAYRAVELAEQEAENRIRAELLRWRDPEEELPVNSEMVLVKLSNACYGVAEYSGRSWCFNGEAPEGNIIGWRPIGEN